MSALSHSLLALVPLAPALAAQDVLTDRRRTPVVEVVERVKPAVVSITTNTNVVQRTWPFGELVRKNAPGPSGTGVVIFEDGFIITNNHVIEGATQIQVRFDETDDDHLYDAEIVSKKPEEDLALLKIEGEQPFHTVTLCETDPILGEPTIAIGNAFGHSHTVSTGIVSGLHRNIDTSEGLRFDNLIQTDASINPGNSGGRLLNINGELIGINCAMQTVAENIGFAIPVNHVRKVLNEQLLSLDEARAWLGFDVDEKTFEVKHVVPGGPAAGPDGLQVGDRLTGLAGHLLASLDGDPRDVYRRIRISIQPGKEVPITFTRGKRELKFTLPSAWNKVDGILFERLGLGLDTVRMGRRGGDPYLQVTMVQEGGPAANTGVKVGDIVYSLQREGRRATSFQRADDLAGAISRLPTGTVLTVVLVRDVDGDGLYFESDPENDYSETYRGSITLR